jgi:hypothetical protein
VLAESTFKSVTLFKHPQRWWALALALWHWTCDHDHRALVVLNPAEELSMHGLEEFLPEVQ